MRNTATVGQRIARGFSLIEMMIVIVIIAIVVALVVPALGAARGVAKDADTRSLMNSLSQAASQFSLDYQGRAPGYFSALAMANADNGDAGEGFSGMQNALLDLAGGVLTKPVANATGPDEIVVGPSATASKNVVVNTTLIGTATSGKAYFVPLAKYFKKQDGADAAIRGIDVSGASTASVGNKALPELCDSTGQPLLWWGTNPQAVGSVEVVSDFAEQVAGSGGNGSSTARVYWNQNSVFCSAFATGGQYSNNLNNSLLSIDNANKLVTLTALLGNPNTPNDANLPTRAEVLPTAARGTAVIHAAGRDNIYLNGSKGRGGINAGGVTGGVFYGSNFFSDASTRRLDSDQKRSSVDVLADFDDMINAIE